MRAPRVLRGHPVWSRRARDQTTITFGPTIPKPVPRAVFPYSNFQAEVWCISDVLEHLDSSLQSSSEQKAKYLPKMFAYGVTPDLVIAVGTAQFPDPAVSENGNVVVGTKVVMVDGHPNGSNPLST